MVDTKCVFGILLIFHVIAPVPCVDDDKFYWAPELTTTFHTMIHSIESSFVEYKNAEMTSSFSLPKNNELGCRCEEYTCGCCEQISLAPLIEGKFCTSLSYLPKDLGILVAVIWNNYLLVNESVSEAPCFFIPELKAIYASICTEFYDLSFDNGKFHGCVRIKFRIYPMFHKDLPVGCFDLPPTSQDLEKFDDIFYNILNTMTRFIKQVEDEFSHLINHTSVLIASSTLLWLILVFSHIIL